MTTGKGHDQGSKGDQDLILKMICGIGGEMRGKVIREGGEDQSLVAQRGRETARERERTSEDLQFSSSTDLKERTSGSQQRG